MTRACGAESDEPLRWDDTWCRCCATPRFGFCSKIEGHDGQHYDDRLDMFWDEEEVAHA